jgi:N-methylhydantoinase A
VVNAAVTVVGRLPEIELPALPSSGQDASSALVGKRPMLFRGAEGYRETPVYGGSRLRAGNLVAGPAVVEEANTTVVVLQGFQLELTPFSSYLMRQMG